MTIPGEGVESVTCRLCGREFKAIMASHLIRVHGFDPAHPGQEYKRLTGETRLRSEATQRKTTEHHVATLEQRGQHWDRARVIREIRARHARGEPLTLAGDPEFAASMLVQMARRSIGSWRAAVEAAGFDPDDELLRIRWTDEAVIDAIRAEHAAGRDLRPKAVEERFSALSNAVRRSSFGSWRAALAAAGINPDSVLRIRAWSREAVVHALRQIGRVLSIKEIERRDPGLCHAIYRYVGSYDTALREAGLAPLRHTRRREHAGITSIFE